MKKVVILLSLSFLLTNMSFANSNRSINPMEYTSTSLMVESTKFNTLYFESLLNSKKKKIDKVFGKCTIRVNITLDDGTRIKGKVTFHDVGFFECIGIKAANLWSKIF